MSTDTIPDIYEKPGVPYSTTTDDYSTTTIGAALPTVETASVVNPPMGGGAPSSDPLNITFSGTIATPPSMTVDTPITPITISTNFSGGPPPKVYSVFSGTLPPGLALNATTGVVSGTPTTPQAAANVVFRGTDNNGNTANSNGVPFTVTASIPAWAARSFNRGTGNTVSGTIPAGSIGDILVAMTVFAGGGNIALLRDVGWPINSGIALGESQIVTVHSKIATGSDTFSYTCNGGGAWASVVLRFPAGAYSIIANNSEDAVVGTSFNPIAATVTEAATYLWFALCGVGQPGNACQNFLTYPAGYSNSASSFLSAAAGVACLGMAELISATLTQDPGAFTVTTSDLGQMKVAAMRTLGASAAAPTLISTGISANGNAVTTFTMPTGVAVGDLLLAQIGTKNQISVTIDTAFSGSNWKFLPIKQQTNGGQSQQFLYKIAEASNALRVNHATVWGTSVCYCIRNASPNRFVAIQYNPGVNSGTANDAKGITPISGSREYLALATMFSLNANINVTAYPSGYSNTSASPLSVDIGTIFSAWKTATAAAFAAATFTSASTVQPQTTHLLFWGADA